MASSDVSLLASELEKIRNLTGEELFTRFQTICPSKRPGENFTAKLDSAELDTVYKCSLLLSTVTDGKKIPREFQLKAVLALLARRDCLINAGTGSGKTLCMVLPALLDPTMISLVISPLKRLQVLQVSCINDLTASTFPLKAGRTSPISLTMLKNSIGFSRSPTTRRTP
jgi:ATP-dependent helicase YprA (DUF1998 family)